MKYVAYVAEIENDVDATDLDFETTNYQQLDAALVSPDRIRLEWMQSDEFYGITIDRIFEKDDGEYGSGTFECDYPSWEGRRSTKKLEAGRVTASFIRDDDGSENPFHQLDAFWIDIKWHAHDESGRLLFEVERNGKVAASSSVG